MILAKALTDLSKVHVDTQITVQSNMLTSTWGYINVVRNCSRALDIDENNAASYSEYATTGNITDATKAAEWHARYEVDSTIMNKEMGRESATVNTEQVMEHTQAENLTPVYSILEYEALLFATTSGLIDKQG